MSNIHSLSDILGKDEADKKDLVYTNGASSGTYVRAPSKNDAQNPTFFDNLKQNGVQNESGRHNGPQKPGETLVRVTIIMWENGITVKEHPPGSPNTPTTSVDRHEDVPLRTFDDPKTKEFVDSLTKNQLPAEFAQNRDRVYDFEVVDRRTQKWTATPPSSLPQKPPQPAHVAFSGEGFSLGKDSPASDVAGSELVAGRALPVPDKAKPTTRIQIRLGNGKRVVGVFNQSHSVADLYAFTEANSCAPGKKFNLITVAPPVRTLMDMEMTLADAKLLNSVVSQKFV